MSRSARRKRLAWKLFVIPISSISRNCLNSNLEPSRVEPHHDVPGCNSFPVPMYGSPSPVRSLLDTVYYSHACCVFAIQLFLILRLILCATVHRKQEVRCTSRKCGMRSRLLSLHLPNDRVTGHFCYNGALFGARGAVATPTTPTTALCPSMCVLKIAAIGCLTLVLALSIESFALLSLYGCWQLSPLCNTMKPSIWKLGTYRKSSFRKL